MVEKAGISFCIISGGQRPDRLERLIESIREQSVPSFEIIVCGNYVNDTGVTYLPKPEWAKKAEVCKMRNFAASNASFDTVIILDDDVEFTYDWWSNISDKKDFQIAGCKGVDGNGKRWWDWQKIERGNPLADPVLLEYGETDKDAYISGYFMMMKKQVWEDVRFDEDRRNYQHDDIDFCHRATDKGYSIKIFPEAKVIHHVDWRGREENELSKAEFIKENSSPESDLENGQMHLKLKEYRLAIPFFKKVAKNRPEFKYIYDLAFCYQQLGAFNNAIKYYLDAVGAPGEKDNSRFASAYLHLGELFIERESYELAVNCFKSALAHSPDNKKAAELLENLEMSF